MRVVLLGLSLLSILNIVVAVEPVNVDLLLETTDDEDLIWLLQKHRKRRSTDDINKRLSLQTADQGVPNEVISGLERKRRDVDAATGASVAGTGTGTNSDGAGGTAPSSSNGGSDDSIDYSGGSGEGSGEGADYDTTDTSHVVT